ncbi:MULTISPECIES: hypothetical protein [Streptomyces]|uniref:hypothetical protein n=1 Tax=Streptomyces TaxID=1883 RepID=UPI00211D4AAA|nr:hypothetical protein [Streptomyces sp. wa1063]
MSEQQTEPTTEAPTEDTPQCAFPECTATPVPKDPAARGRAPKYCPDPDHNAMSAYRAKRGNTSSTKALAEEPSDRVVTDAARTAGIVQGTVLEKVSELQKELARYVDLLQTVTDPEAAEAEVAAVAATADSQVAEWRKKTTTANTERDAAVRQRELARAETKEAQDAADHAIAELEKETARFERETEKVREKAAADVATVQDEIRQVRENTEKAIRQAHEEAKTEADRRVKDAQDKAGKAEVEATVKVEAMEKTVKAVQAETGEAVKKAQGEATAAEKRAREAEARALQADRDAETRVKAEKERRTEQEKAHAAELGRAIDRHGVLEGQVENLNKAVNDTKDQMREVQTELALAQAEIKRLTPAGGK